MSLKGDNLNLRLDVAVSFSRLGLSVSIEFADGAESEILVVSDD